MLPNTGGGLFVGYLPQTKWSWVQFLFAVFFFRMKTLQSVSETSATTSHQFYKRFTGLHLQVCKNRPTFKINYSPKCCQIQYANAWFNFETLSSLTEKHDHFELDTTCGHKLF